MKGWGYSLNLLLYNTNKYKKLKMFDNKNKFLTSGFSTRANSFFNGFVPLKQVTYCVVIIYDNDYKKEIYGIDNPWKFMNSLKKNPRIKNCYIKDENNP
jgi:hypothetical protein